MHSTLAAATTTTITTFKPRQVLLSLSSAMKNSNLTTPAHPPSSDSKRIILNSICEYLERNGFFKSVKKLRSEAKIEADGEEEGLLDLEALCNEQLKIRLKAVGFKEKGEGKKEKKEIIKETFEDHQLVVTSEKTDNAIEEEEAKSKSKRKKEEAAVDDDLSAKETRTTERDKPSKKGKLLEDKTEDKKSLEKEKVSSEQVAGEAEKDAALFSEGKKRKKKNKKNDAPDGSEGENKDNVSSEQVGGEVEKDAALISEGKKRKKKNKEIDAPDGSEGENKEHKTEEKRLVVVEGKGQTGVPTLVACSINGDAAGSAKQAKSKGKRKKEDSPIQENSLTDTTALAGEDATKKADLPTSEGPTDEKRVSKKRKKLAEENGNGHMEEKQEIGSLSEMKKSKKHKSIPLSEDADDEVGKGEKEPDKISQSMGDEGKVRQPNLQTPSGKDADVIPAKNGGEQSTQKSSSKQHNGSAEPRALNAFQRVKAEEVEFKDERLQDNSYWAKDGADSGYGAKAQEILGQVKGRDFRHEKTKKKRGSYRGGQIDLQSHSVKFNYSDDE